eukprot:184658_1
MTLKLWFMLFWSLSSGFGIVFAISSWIYELHSLKQDPFFCGFKGTVSLFIGSIIGLTHFKLSDNDASSHITNGHQHTKAELQHINRSPNSQSHAYDHSNSTLETSEMIDCTVSSKDNIYHHCIGTIVQ